MSKYLENGMDFPVEKKEREKLIGKKIQYLTSRDVDKVRGLYFPQTMIIKEYFRGHIIAMNGDIINVRTIIEFSILPQVDHEQ